MSRDKTSEGEVRKILSKEPAHPDADRPEPLKSERSGPRPKNPDARQSEFPVSAQGMHQEDRRHNKPGNS
jgi:hypothetical protein